MISPLENKIRKILFYLIFIFLTVLAPMYAAFAAPEEADFFDFSLTELHNYNVSIASHQEENIPGTPAVVSRYTPEDLNKMGINSFKDMLSFIPGIVMPNSTLGNQPVMIRGLVETFNQKVLFLIDDIPYWMSSHSDFPTLGIPIEAIEHIEVIRGPGAVYYGTNASAGVIKVITRKDTGNTLAISGGSNKLLRGSGYLSYAIDDSSHISLAFEKQNDNGYTGDYENMSIPPNFPANTPASRSATNSESTRSFLAQYSNTNLHLILQGFKSTVESLSGPASAINPGYFDSEGYLLGADYTWYLENTEIKLFSDYNRYYPSLYADNFLGGVKDGYTKVDNSGHDNYRWRSGVNLSYAWKKQLKFFFGAEYEKRETASYGVYSEETDKLVAPIYPEADLVESSVYAQVDYILSNWRFLLGARYVDNEKSGSDIMPRLSGIYKIDNRSSLKLLYSVGFNSPNFLQLEANSSGLVSSAADLVAETVHSLDLAYTFTTLRKLFVANLYYLRAKDSIQRNRVGGVINHFNGESFDRYGAEFDFQYRSKDWTVFTNLTYNHQGNRNIDDDELALFVPRLTANFGATYYLSGYQSLGGSLQYLSDRAKADAVTVLNVNYSHTFNKFELFATLRNLTDEKIQHPDVINLNKEGLVPGGDGINILLGLKYNF